MSKKGERGQCEQDVKELRDNEGLSFDKIADILGITKQHAHYAYKKASGFSKKELELIESVKFGAIRTWMKENMVTLKELCARCGVSGSTNSHFCMFLQGKNKGNIDEIRKVLKVTKMKFEQAFKEDKK